MPIVDSTVGRVPVPLPPGPADAPIVDPTVAGLLDYLAFWAKYALEPKLLTMTAPPVTDACPVASRYPVNPSSLVARFNRPALFVWWDGKSIIRPWTTVKDVRQRDFQALYVFDRVASDTVAGEDARIRYAGLISALDAAWARAISRRNHPNYQPPGFRANTPIGIILGVNAIDYLGGQEGFLQELSTSSARAQAVQTGPPRLSRGNAIGILQGYPCLRSVFRVVEEIGVDTPTPADTAPDLLYTPSVVSGDPLNPLALDARYLPSADELDVEEP